MRLLLDFLTVFGTVGATVVALWLGLRENCRRVDSTFIWEGTTSYQPTLLVQNISNRIVVMESIEIRYRNKQACFVQMLDTSPFSEQAIIEGGQTTKIPMKGVKLDFPTPVNQHKKYKLKVIIRLRRGWKCTSVSKYCYDELLERFWGQGFCEED